MLELFPDTAAVDDGELTLGGLRASELAGRFGTPLVVLCEATLRARARAYRRAAPDALVVYGTKAFPNVALLRLFASEGLGADVSTLGELEFARRAGLSGTQLVVHGNNKGDDELRAAGALGALVALDAPGEADRALSAGVRRLLVRVTPGIEADTHEAIRTAHRGSKFGLTPEQALEALAERPEIEGLHVHIGSQLVDTRAARMTIDWLAGFAARCRTELGWTPALLDLGGGLGVAHVGDEAAPAIERFVGELLDELERAWRQHELPAPHLILEPGRSLVAEAGVTLYRVGVVKQASETTTYVAIDGGMSDNPRPQLYGARYEALVANRAGDEPGGRYSVAGKHCESGDVLIEGVRLADPVPGDLLAVPVTGAYTLAMGSNYNAVPRPAVVLVGAGAARVIRRRETIDDLLELESPP